MSQMQVSGWISHRNVNDDAECGHEWSPEEQTETTNDDGDVDSYIAKDSNGNVLRGGDSGVLIKKLPVTGASRSIKAGTRVKNIKLTSGHHNLDCKIE